MKAHTTSATVIITVEDFGQSFESVVERLAVHNMSANWRAMPVGARDPELIFRKVQNADAAIIGGEYWGQEIIRKVEGKMKLLVRFGSGYDKVDVDAAKNAGISVANAPGTFTSSVAEHALALLLCVTRKIVHYDRSLRLGEWSPTRSSGLHGKTVGIIGFGNIGREFCRLIRSFGVTILVFDPYAGQAVAGDSGIRFVGFTELLEKCDIISLHVALTDETRKLIDVKALGKMRRGAILINTSRGGVIDEEALIRSCADGHLGGVGLDVFEREPLESSSRLFSFDTVVLTPHAAAVEENAFEATARNCSETILSYFLGQKPDNLILDARRI